MPEIRFTLSLTSDAEPGTGLGTKLINDLVPRDERGRAYFPASHLKGVAREEFRQIASALGWGDALEAAVFGRATDNSLDEFDGAARFGACRPASAGSPGGDLQLISRTALSDHGTAQDGALRTVEAIRAGTRFEGCVVVADSDAAILDAVRLSLLSIAAIGGNRNRGAGRCAVTLVDEPALEPSTVLRRLDGGARDFRPVTRALADMSGARGLDGATTLLELTFAATDPVCCPVVPLTGTNSIGGGFAIPASAVQGALLHLLNAEDPGLATSVFASSAFRAWPLLPVALSGEDAGKRRATWTSLTHRMSKASGGFEAPPPFFRDRMIEPYDAREVPSGAPLKGADGVLLHDGSSVALWKSSDMPRRLTAHVNLQNDEPLLYSVEAMAPAVYRGWLAIPTAAAAKLLAAIERQPIASFGRSKTVRGSGRLSARSVDASALVPAGAEQGRVFVLQSPVLVPRAWVDGSEEPQHGGALLQRLVEESGIGRCEAAEASIEFRFGWNRHGQGSRVAGTKRLGAEPVFAPGSIFSLANPASDPTGFLLRGIGSGRERGFGAVLPHPGIARALHRGAAALPVLRSRDSAGRIVMELVELSATSGLSASTISQLARLAGGGPKAIEEFLERQKQRQTKHWKRWETVIERVKSIARDTSISDETRVRIFRAWVDSTVAKGGN